MSQTYFITGTGTDIGKTYVTSLLARYTTDRGFSTAVMKPAQTGMTDPMNGDLGKVKAAAPGILDIPMELACPYCLEFESSPHLAAELAGLEIDLKRITDAYAKIRTQYNPDVLLLESAGGIYVPLNQRQIMADIPAALGIPAIIVADAALGTINHTVLTINELRRRDVEVRGVIVNRVPEDPEILIRDNLKMIEKFGKVEIIAQAGTGKGFIDDLGLRHIF